MRNERVTSRGQDGEEAGNGSFFKRQSGRGHRGASGIGEKTAEFFIQEQVKVLIADVKPERVEKTVASLRAMGGEAQGIVCDVRDEKSATRMVEQAVASFGTVDFLVNSAGIGGAMNPLETAAREEWQPILDINLIGTINCCKAVMPVLKAKKGGRIINLASEAGVSGEKGLEVYAASKGGRDRPHQIPGERPGLVRDNRKCRRPGLRSFAHDRFPESGIGKEMAEGVYDQASGGDSGYRQHDRFLMLAALLLDHRPDDFHQRRVFDEVRNDGSNSALRVRRCSWRARLRLASGAFYDIPDFNENNPWRDANGFLAAEIFGSFLKRES